MLEGLNFLLSFTSSFPIPFKALYFAFEKEDSPLVFGRSATAPLSIKQLKSFSTQVEHFQLKIGDFQTQRQQVGVGIVLSCKLLKGVLEYLFQCPAESFLLLELILSSIAHRFKGQEGTLDITTFIVVISHQSPKVTKLQSVCSQL